MAKKEEMNSTYTDGMLNEMFEDEQGIVRSVLVTLLSLVSDVVYNCVLDALEYRERAARGKRRVSPEGRKRMSQAARASWEKRSPEVRKRQLSNLKQFKKDGK